MSTREVQSSQRQQGDTQIRSIRLPGFVGGLNTEADEFQLEITESPDCMNVDFGLRGAVAKRAGYTQYSTGSDFGVTRAAMWKAGGGSNDMIVIGADGSLEWADVDATQTFTNVVTSWGAPGGMDDWWSGIAALDDVVYVSRVDNQSWQFNGTTWATIADFTLDGSGTEFPKAAHLLSMHERIFAANIDNAGTRYRSRVQFSDAGDANTWPAANWIDVNPDDGQQITGLIAYGEAILVFKERSVYVLSGTDKTSFTLYPLDDEIGTLCPQTAVNAEGILIFFDPSNGVYAFDGANFNRIDEKITLHLLDGMNFSASYKAAGEVYRDKYYLSVPWGAATDNSRTFVYDLKTKAWTQYDYGMNTMLEFASDLYGGEASGTGGIYQMLDGISDDGVAISAYFETSWMSPENEDVKGRVRRADFAFTAVGDVDVTVKMFRDFAVNEFRTQTVNIDPQVGLWGTMVWGVDLWGGGVDQVYKRTTGWPGRWRVIKFRFEEAGVASAAFQLNRMNLHYTTLSRVRGTP